MRKLSLGLLLIILLAGCAGVRTSCPEFPIPSSRAAMILDEVSKYDQDVYIWMNQLLDLCQQLGTCKEE